MVSERAAGQSPGTWRSDARTTEGGRPVNRRRGAEATTTDPRDEELVEAACAALRPYQWRTFTPELLARLLLAVSDRQHVHGLLVGVPGAAVGPWDVLDAADRHDVRVRVLVEFLLSHHWTELSLCALCRELVALLDSRT